MIRVCEYRALLPQCARVIVPRLSTLPAGERACCCLRERERERGRWRVRESGVRVSENLRFKTPTAPNSSPRVLDLTGQILEYNAAHYTVWHIRRKCLFASQRRRLKTKESIPELASLELWRRQLFVYERSRRRRARATCYSLCSFVCRGTREIFSAVAWTHSSAPSFGATQARVGRRRRHDSRRARVRERLPRDSLSLSLSLSRYAKSAPSFSQQVFGTRIQLARGCARLTRRPSPWRRRVSRGAVALHALDR